MSDKKAKLRPCPFCGTTSVGYCTLIETFKDSRLYEVCCASCGGRGGKQRTAKLAQELWNRREPQPYSDEKISGFTEEESEGIAKGRKA